MVRDMKLRLSHLLLSTLLLVPALTFNAQAAGGSSGGEEAVDQAVLRITGSQHYVPVQGVIAPIIGIGGFDSMMVVDIGLDIESDAERRRAQNQMPRIKDALLRGLQSFLAMGYEKDSVPNLDELGRRLQRNIDQVMGVGVAQVTIASAIVHD